MEMDIVKASLRAACEQPGCPICRLGQQAEAAYLQTLLADYVNDELTRWEVVHSQGLCADHAWLLQASAQRDWESGDKPSILYESAALFVQERLAAFLSRHRASDGAPLSPLRRRARRGRLERKSPFASPLERLLAALERRAACPVCEALQGKEALWVGKLAAGSSDPSLWAAFVASDGLCLPHLKAALACCADEDAAWRLAQMAEAKLSALLAHLQAAMEKRQWAGAPPMLPAEEAAWIRMIAFFAGEARHGRANEAVRLAREEAQALYRD